MSIEKDLEHYFSKHYIHRSNRLRAAVLGANDGILSTSSLAIGVATASKDFSTIILAMLSGIIAGSLSMAAGEYVSVKSQSDLENADIERERKEIEDTPEEEYRMLAKIYEERGLKKETSLLVAKELMEHDALGAHIRDELGITNVTKANSIQAAVFSGISFVVGGILPLLVVLLIPQKYLYYSLYIFCVLFLGILGAVSAKSGGYSAYKSSIRIMLLGFIAMALSALVGEIFGTIVLSQ